jgi:hypothetical protein
MKQSTNKHGRLTQQLQDLPQMQMPKDIFSDIQEGLDKRSFIRKHKFVSSFSMVAVLVLSVGLFKLSNRMDEKDLLIQELVKRTMQMEQLLAKEEPRYTLAGSAITERIVNIEGYLAELDISIQQTKDKQKKSQLIAAKLDLLGDLVLLQRKINHKSNYQKVKPLII